MRVGVLGALALAALADRRGRRRVLLWATTGACLLTVVSALAPGLVALGHGAGRGARPRHRRQHPAHDRGGRGDAGRLARVRRQPARGDRRARRGPRAVRAPHRRRDRRRPAGPVRAARSCCSSPRWPRRPTEGDQPRAGPRILLALGVAMALGFLLFAGPLSDTGERGWRVIYVLPLLFLPGAVAHRPDAAREPPVRRRPRRRRAWPATAAGSGCWRASAFLLALFTAPASQLMNEFLRDERGLQRRRGSACSRSSPTRPAVSASSSAAGSPTPAVVAWSAPSGRRPACCSPSPWCCRTGWPMWVLSVLGAIMGAMVVPALGVYGPELFPTSLRGKANGIITIVGVAGSVLGLLVGRAACSDRWDGLGPALARAGHRSAADGRPRARRLPRDRPSRARGHQPRGPARPPPGPTPALAAPTGRLTAVPASPRLLDARRPVRRASPRAGPRRVRRRATRAERQARSPPPRRPPTTTTDATTTTSPSLPPSMVAQADGESIEVYDDATAADADRPLRRRRDHRRPGHVRPGHPHRVPRQGHRPSEDGRYEVYLPGAPERQHRLGRRRRRRRSRA